MDRNFAGWMIAGGFRYDDPTANRHAEHLAALRMTESESVRSDEPNQLMARLVAVLRPASASAATSSGSIVNLDPSCCAA